MEQRTETMEKERLISESDLLKILGLRKPELDKLRREKGLPFIRFSSKSRAYFLSDLLDWSRRNRLVINTEPEENGDWNRYLPPPREDFQDFPKYDE